jgi:hypothetical protein
MDEGRKRVLGIMAAILTSLHMQTADDLFGAPQKSPRSDKLIAASIQWAEIIMAKIDERFSKQWKGTDPMRNVLLTGRVHCILVVNVFPQRLLGSNRFPQAQRLELCLGCGPTDQGAEVTSVSD